MRVPRDPDHRFHGNAITRSTGSRSPIPRQAEQAFQFVSLARHGCSGDTQTRQYAADFIGGGGEVKREQLVYSRIPIRFQRTPSGQENENQMTTARPMMFSWLMGPLKRLSMELSRLSPITNAC